MHIKISSFFANDLKGLKKISSKLKSFPHAVKVDVSRASDNAGKGFLFIWGLNLTTNSAAKCCASAAEPPFPQMRSFPEFSNELKIMFETKEILFFKRFN